MKIAFLGNFGPVFSTESHLKWTWEKLGHEVIPLQENQCSTSDVLAACSQSGLFEWSHTHGWMTAGQFSMDEIIKQRLPRMGVPSFSYHLDLYFGLNALDKRQDNVGEHASWKVSHFFSTDGREDNPWKERGVNHHWLLPGVVEYGCVPGQPQPELMTDVAFVGSSSYHPEYGFRRTLNDSLRGHYGNSFHVYSGYREQKLNDLLASIRVCVGDHCFAGIPRYCSDRLFETIGRGGFIIYPETEGVTNLIPGLVTFRPKDLSDLYGKIDYYLTHEAERIERRDIAHNWIKQHGTYTQRVQELLRVMELQ